MKEIPLSQGKVALVDDADYAAVNVHKWEARIVVNGYKLHLGLFSVEIDAARARDVAALKYYGEGAQLNFKVA